MKNVKKIATAALAAGIITTSSFTAYAGTETAEKFVFTHDKFVSGASETIGLGAPRELTDEQKAEMQAKMTERFSELLAEGEITQEEYDKAIEGLADGNMVFGKGFGFGDRQKVEMTDEQKAEMQAKMTERLSELLSEGEITQEEYDKAIEGLADGNMFFGKGFGGKQMFEMTDEQKAEMQAKMTERLSELLAEGEITQEEYDKALEGLADGNMLFGKGFGGKQMFEMTDEQKAEMQAKMTERLSELLAEGEITQEEYDKALEGLADGNMVFGKRFAGKQMFEMTDEQKAEMQAKMTERFSELLTEGEITQEEYDKALEGLADGKMKIFIDRKMDQQA